MPSVVRSYSKINLGLAIGGLRPDGFHSLATLYQTLALHDLLTISARPSLATHIHITSNDPRVPRDPRNTAWKMVELALDSMGRTATVSIRIEKRLPIQGGMGAGSANAAAALLGLERELRVRLPDAVRLRIAAQVGSDVPLFLIGGSVLGSDRGQIVCAASDMTLNGSAEIPCVIALPSTGVSTPQAFRDWDARLARDSASDLHREAKSTTLEKLNRVYASVVGFQSRQNETGASGKIPERGLDANPASPEKQQARLSDQHHTTPLGPLSEKSSSEIDLAGNSLLALVRTGIENDFETVVFPQNPLLGEIKKLLMGSQHESRAVYAALSGSGSALFGLYQSVTDANVAQQRLQQHGVQAIVTSTMPRPLYWSKMFAE